VPAAEGTPATGAAVDVAAPAAVTTGQIPTAAAPETVEATSAAVATRGLIKGTVSDAAGSPISDVAIVIVEGTSPWPEMATYSSAAGAYQWLVDAGTYTLEASRDGYASARGEVTVVAGQETVLDLTLSAP
jgi:hypothetical protein